MTNKDKNESGVQDKYERLGEMFLTGFGAVGSLGLLYFDKIGEKWAGIIFIVSLLAFQGTSIAKSLEKIAKIMHGR